LAPIHCFDIAIDMTDPVLHNPKSCNGRKA